jgi:ADP-heptose:LPS heptosyltransferase
LPTAMGVLRQRVQFEKAALPAFVRAPGPRILFQRHGGIGDVICTFPAVLALRRKFPQAIIVYRVLPELIPIVRMGGVADAVVPIQNWQLSPPPWLERRFDMLFQPYLEDERPSGLPQDVHLVDSFCAKVGVLACDRQPRLTVPRGLGQRISSQFFNAPRNDGPLIAIHTSPAWKVREWSDEGWSELVSWLVYERRARVIQLGHDVHRKNGPVEVTRIEGAVDCVGRFSLEETAACLQLCDLVVGVDSGLLHMAGAVGTPCVGLFGAINPALRLPTETPSIGVASDVPCLGCHHRLPVAHWEDGCPMEIACMKSLPVARVAEACDKLLGQRNCRVDATRGEAFPNSPPADA